MSNVGLGRYGGLNENVPHKTLDPKLVTLLNVLESLGGRV